MGKYPIYQLQSRLHEPSRVAGENIIRSGDFEYRVNYSWLQMPTSETPYSVCGIAIGNGDHIYLAVRHPKHRILVFSPDGSFDRFLADDISMGIAHGISVNHDGHLWIADDWLNTIQLIDRDSGAVLRTLGESGNASETGVEEYWHGDSNAHLTITRTGEPFNRPTRLIEASNGKLYVADGYWNAAVHRFSRDGIHEATWGSHGTNPGQMFSPHSIWEDKRGRIWVADRNQDRITAFDGDGNYVTMIDRLMMPADVWSDDQFLYVAELDRRISVFDMDCRPVAQLGYVGSRFLGHHMAGDSQGNLYINYNSSVHRQIRLERLS